MNGKIARMDLGFSLILVFGVLIGLARTANSVAPERSLRLVDQGMLVLLGALLGSRAGYVGLQWDYFQVHPGEIFQVWLGGMSGSGAAYGFVVGVVLVAWLHADRVANLADRLIPLGLSLTASGWLAAWWAGSAYGVQIDAWYAVPARGEAGLWAMRFPTQLIGALLSLMVWIGLDLVKRLEGDSGVRASLGLLGVGLILLVLSFNRVDPIPVWHNFRLDTWAAFGLCSLAGLGIILIGLSGMAAFYRRRKSNI